MKIAVVVLASVVALLVPGGLVGLYLARHFYRHVYLQKGMDQLREELGIAAPCESSSPATGVNQ